MPATIARPILVVIALAAVGVLGVPPLIGAHVLARAEGAAVFQPDATWGRDGPGFRRLRGAWDASAWRLAMGWLRRGPNDLRPPHFVALTPRGGIAIYSFAALGFVVPDDPGVILADPARLAALP